MEQVAKKTVKQNDSASQAKPHRTAKRTKITKKSVAYIVFLVAWAALCTIVSQFLVILPMRFLLGSQVQKPFWMMIYYLLNYAVSVALVIFVPPKLFSKLENSEETTKDLAVTKNDLGVAKAPTFVDIGLVPIAYIIYLVLAQIASTLMRFFPWFDAEQSQEVGFNHYLSGSDRLCAVLAITIIAPIAEELIMRGWLYGKLRNKTKMVPAIIITSVVFAILHGQWNVAVSVFMLSAVLCGLREVTGTIWSGMLLHILNNSIAFYLLFVLNIGM